MDGLFVSSSAGTVSVVTVSVGNVKVAPVLRERVEEVLCHSRNILLENFLSACEQSLRNSIVFRVKVLSF